VDSWRIRINGDVNGNVISKWCIFPLPNLITGGYVCLDTPGGILAMMNMMNEYHGHLQAMRFFKGGIKLLLICDQGYNHEEWEFTHE